MSDLPSKHWPPRVPFVGITPGDVHFSDEDYARDPLDVSAPKWIRFGCPRGHGECSVPIFPQTGANGHSWKWDGNRESPTLTPSINCLAHNPENPAEKYAGCGWHGHLVAGVFTGV